MPCAEQKLTICTPYFNLPAILVRNIIQLLREGKKVEIIVGDKTANDFYIPEDEPFKIIGALPYLYEINLRRFLSRLQYYVNTDQLVVRLWKDDDNTYHLKGMWVDDKWILITGNNLNPRAASGSGKRHFDPRSATGACATARERTGSDPRAYHHR